jgi:hypothetical protein
LGIPHAHPSFPGDLLCEGPRYNVIFRNTQGPVRLVIRADANEEGGATMRLAWLTPSSLHKVSCNPPSLLRGLRSFGCASPPEADLPAARGQASNQQPVT